MSKKILRLFKKNSELIDASIEYNYKGEEVAQQSRQDLQLERSEIVKWKIMSFQQHRGKDKAVF